MTSVPDRPRLLILGAGGHGKVLADLILSGTQYRLEGFVDDGASEGPLGLPLLGRSEDLDDLFQSGITHALCGVGNAKVRRKLHGLLKQAGFTLAVAKHPDSSLSASARLGPGSVLLAQTSVGPDCILGEGSVVNTGATVDHDCHLGDFVQVAPGAHLGGGVRAGAGTFFGLGSSTRQGVKLGQDCMVGVGAAVVSDFPDRSLILGVPGRLARTLEPGEIRI